MKKSYFSTFTLVLLLGMILVFTKSCTCTKRQLTFSRLQVPVDTLIKWQKDTSYSNLALQHYYDSAQGGRWNLRCYGLSYHSNSTTVTYSLYSNTFTTQEDSSVSVACSLTLGNSYLPMGLLSTIIKVATDSLAKQIHFHPVLRTGNNINFIAYRIIIPGPAGNYLSIDSNSIRPEYRLLLKKDSIKGFSYFELNPCPPANITLSDAAAPQNH